MNIQWFPGHMTKARKLIEEYWPKVDVFLELLDARVPLSSRNPLLTELIRDKPRLILLNKTDLVDKASLTAWKNYFLEVEGIPAVLVSVAERKNLPTVIQEAVNLCRGAKWFGTRRVRGMIIGIPNVGKSSLINALSGGRKASTAPQAGHTKGVQRIAVSDHFELLDTPGILWHKFEDKLTGIRLALLGAVSDRILDHLSLSCAALALMDNKQLNQLGQRFKLESEVFDTLKKERDLDALVAPDVVWITPERLEVLELMGRKRGLIQKGGVVDLERAAGVLVQELRAGLLGPVSLDPLPKSTQV